MLCPEGNGDSPRNAMPPGTLQDAEDSKIFTALLQGSPGETLRGPRKRPKSGLEGPTNSSSRLAQNVPTHLPASSAASEVTCGTAAEETASEAAAPDATSATACGAEAAVPQDEALSRNRISSGRHGERIDCPMDNSHSIYALRLQAHLKKCTKARDIAFSHCLPFMRPGVNLPPQQHCFLEQKQQQEHGHPQRQQPHEDYVEGQETAAALTSELEAKISDVYRYALKYLSSIPPMEATGAVMEAEMMAAASPCDSIAPLETAVAPWNSRKSLPATVFISNCCNGVVDTDSGNEEEALLLLRAAADACKVPLGTASAAAGGLALASLEDALENALLLPEQRRSDALLEVLQQLQQRLNKHQKQLLQLLALCLLHSHLDRSLLDETLIVELGAGKADLTRWLCCWSAAAVDAAAPRNVAAASAGPAPGPDPGTSEIASPGPVQRHRGVRCIVVDREARRYCKEAKDKTFRNPNAPRSLHPAALAAAQRRNAAASDASTIMQKNRSMENPLLEEDKTPGRVTLTLCGTALERTVSAAAAAVAAGERAQDAPVWGSPATCGIAVSRNGPGGSSIHAALPVPPVRLRMDIADFSLVALVNYITCKGPLRIPHIPGFFKKLFEYGCRFAAPEAGLEKGNNEAHGFRDRAEGQVRRSSAKERETSNIKQEEPICAATRGPKPRMLLSIEDGSAEDFFAIAQTLGEGGGPSMKKIDELLEEHFRDKRTSSVLGVAKHLCGGGSDVALRCFASARDTTDSRLKFCICIATCCHHRCTTESFVGTQFLINQGFTLAEISILFSLCGWATGATGKKREIGNMVKRILDISRVWWLREKGFTTATLQQFVDSEETPECFAIVAHSHSGNLRK